MMTDLRNNLIKIESNIPIEFADLTTRMMLKVVMDRNIEDYNNINMSSGVRKFISTARNFGCTEYIRNYDGVVYIDELSIRQELKHKLGIRMLNDYIIKKVNSSPDTKKYLLHIFNELDRNVRNHYGYIDKDEKRMRIGYEIQPKNYKKPETLRVVVMDNGKGFLNSFDKSKKSFELDEITSIIYATENGVTAESNHLPGNHFSNNSGYGLFMLSWLTKNNEFNSLEIISNGKYVEINGPNMRGDILDVPPSISSDFTMVAVTIDIESIESDYNEFNTKFAASKYSGKSRFNG